MASYCKYIKRVQEVSYDNGVTWKKVVPEVTELGTLIECNSPDCGFIEPQSRWVNLDPSKEFVCQNQNKYYKQKKQWSYDGGLHWVDADPMEYQQGDMYEQNSYDCDYGVTWVRSEEGYICEVKPDDMFKWEKEGYICGSSETGDEFVKYQKEIEYISTDEGKTWTPTGQEKQGDILETDSIDCGYINNTIYRRWELLPTDFICMGGDDTYGAGIPSYSGGLILTVIIDSAQTISIPFGGGEMQVDWGDGTIDDKNSVHTYASGIYQIKVYGNVTIGVYGTIEYNNFKNSLYAVESWGNTLKINSSDLTDGLFANCNKLLYVADDTYGVLSNITNFTNWFNGCINYSMRSLYIKRNNNFMPLYNAGQTGTGCYSGCTNLYDYGIIPNNWK